MRLFAARRARRAAADAADLARLTSPWPAAGSLDPGPDACPAILGGVRCERPKVANRSHALHSYAIWPDRGFPGASVTWADPKVTP